MYIYYIYYKTCTVTYDDPIVIYSLANPVFLNYRSSTKSISQFYLMTTTQQQTTSNKWEYEEQYNTAGDAFELLAQDHRKFNDIWENKVLKATNDEEKKENMRLLIKEISMHSGAEETLVYPLMRYQ
jgi:hypothetical protein